MDLFLLTLSTIGLLVGLAITYWIHSQYRMEVVVRPSPSLSEINTKPPLVSVIVPARNEGRNIRRCILALLAQDYPNFEVIVVDDRSTDETPRILADLQRSSANAHQRLIVIQGDELPTGWAGKPYALTQGAAVARGDWLCFVDADTFAIPELLSATYACAQSQRADLFTMLTDQELGSFWEKSILPLVFTALSFGFPAARVNDPQKPDAIANGQFILIRADVYHKLGGHEAVRGRIDEDKALAELVKRAGHRLVIADGRLVARTRMYTSLPEIWEGWTKNIYLGLQDRLWLLLFGAVVGLLGALILPFWLLAGVVWLAAGGGIVAAIIAIQALIVWGYLIAERMRVSRGMGISPLFAFTLPLGTLLFTAMMFVSAYNVLSGKGVTWKGRVYSQSS